MKYFEKKYRFILMLLVAIALLSACATTHTEPYHPTKTAMDKLREAVTLTDAVDLAQKIIEDDPHKWEPVFKILLEKATANPHPDNRKFIRHVYKQKVKAGKLEKRTVFAKLNRFLSTEFVTIQERKDKSYIVCQDLPRFNIALREELKDKKIGLLLASDSKELYNTAESKAARYMRTFEGLCTALSYNNSDY